MSGYWETLRWAFPTVLEEVSRGALWDSPFVLSGGAGSGSTLLKYSDHSDHTHEFAGRHKESDIFVIVMERGLGKSLRESFRVTDANTRVHRFFQTLQRLRGLGRDYRSSRATAFAAHGGLVLWEIGVYRSLQCTYPVVAQREQVAEPNTFEEISNRVRETICHLGKDEEGSIKEGDLSDSVGRPEARGLKGTLAEINVSDAGE